MGDLDETNGGGRPYKNEKRANRLRTPDEIQQLQTDQENKSRETMDELSQLSSTRNKKKMVAIQSRGAASTILE